MQNGGKLLPFSSSFPFQASINHVFNNGNMTLLKIDYLIFGMGAFLVHIKLPFLLTQMWHISNYFCFSFMFFKLVQFKTQITSFPFIAKHTMHLTWSIFPKPLLSISTHGNYVVHMSLHLREIS